MKKGDIFLHPVTKKKCEVTRFYNNKSWYYKVFGTNKEIRAIITADQIIPYSSRESFLNFLKTTGDIEEALANYKPIPIGAKVKLKVDKILNSRFNYTEIFKKFLEDNRNTIFTVKDTSPHIVSLEETNYTFWEHYLYIIN